MTDAATTKKAFDDAQKQLDEEKIKELKGIVYRTLQGIEDAKKKVAEGNEEIRVLKLDLEDLRHGRLKEIKERQLESPLAKQVSKVVFPKVDSVQLFNYNNFGQQLMDQSLFWTSTAGTYTTTGASGINHTIYLSM